MSIRRCFYVLRIHTSDFFQKSQCTVCCRTAYDVMGCVPAILRVHKNLMSLPVRSLGNFRVEGDTGASGIP